MSCNRDSNRAGQTAGVLAGLPRIGSKLSNFTGSVINQVRQAGNSDLAAKIDTAVDYSGRMMSPGAAFVTDALKAVGAPETKKMAGIAGGATLGYMLVKDKPSGIRKGIGAAAVGSARLASMLAPQVWAAAKVVKEIDMVSSLAGDFAGFASRQEDAGQVMQEKRSLFFFKSKTPVTLWKSSLTGLINRQDVVGTSQFSGKNIVSSEGMMFRTGGKTSYASS